MSYQACRGLVETMKALVYSFLQPGLAYVLHTCLYSSSLYRSVISEAHHISKKIIHFLAVLVLLTMVRVAGVVAQKVVPTKLHLYVYPIVFLLLSELPGLMAKVCWARQDYFEGGLQCSKPELSKAIELKRYLEWKAYCQEEISTTFTCCSADPAAYASSPPVDQSSSNYNGRRYLGANYKSIRQAVLIKLMADNEQQEIEEPAEVVEQVHQQPIDHIPLKDEFSSDLSEIDLNDYADKQEDPQASQKVIGLKPKRKKIVKSYQWKHKWVPQANIVPGSRSIWLKKWVRVKYVPTEEELQELKQQLSDKDKGALQLAHAIILEQMNKDN